MWFSVEKNFLTVQGNFGKNTALLRRKSRFLGV